HHPETALSASNLFLIYDALGDSKKAVSVTRHLHWLAERPVDEIPAGLREIRELVLQAKREADAAKTGPRES
ncbi:MAG TPA: hypothetical protein VK447_14940, partial [Myxococcaceae bacterium]|nr:hypothetical protein [Myxococcaceae bacterium]